MPSNSVNVYDIIISGTLCPAKLHSAEELQPEEDGGEEGSIREKQTGNFFFFFFSCRLPEIICSTFVTVPKAPVTKCLSPALSKGEASLKIRGCPHERGS